MLDRTYLAPLLVLLSPALLMVPAFINGYPLVYSDTSTYLASGFLWETPFDRPITYGLFVRLSSLNGASLWLTVYFQSLLVSWTIWLLVSDLMHQWKEWGFLLVMVLLASFTSLSWTCSQLMPDIFTPIMMLSASLVLVKKGTTARTVVLFVLFTVSACMHMSHLVTGLAFLLFCTVIFRLPAIRRTIHFSPYRRIALLGLLTIASVLTMGSAMAKSRHAFFMGAMVEHGIVQAYLQKHCEEKKYRLCQYKDSLDMRAYEFLWNKSSPFYTMGDFSGTRDEFNEIIYGTLTEPEFILLHISASLKATARQCTLFKMGDGNGPFIAGTELAGRIKEYLPGEYPSYLNDRQNKGELGFLAAWNAIQAIFVALALVALLWLWIATRKKWNEWRIFVVALLSFVVMNMWASATFANAIDRLGSKVIWIIPLLALLTLWNKIASMKRNTSISSK